MLIPQAVVLLEHVPAELSVLLLCLFLFLFGTAGMLCGVGSMKRTVSVRPSICPIHSLQQRAVGFLLWAWQARYIGRLLQQRGRMPPH